MCGSRPTSIKLGSSGSAEGCADLGQRVLNPVQAASKNSPIPTAVTASNRHAEQSTSARGKCMRPRVMARYAAFWFSWLAGKGVRISANEYQTRCIRLEKLGTTNGRAQGCADLGRGVSNPVQADGENSQTPRTVVIAHGSAVHTPRYIGGSARHHARVMRLQGNQTDTETISDRW